jgi:ribosomal-protein-serine acetyltransferase
VSEAFLDLGDGLEVRRLEPGDAETVFLLVEANRERLREWMPWAHATTSPDDTRAFIQGARSSTIDEEGLGIFVGGVHAGNIGLRIRDEPFSEAEIGYWIGAEHEGRGYVTRACRALIDHAFRVRGSHRVTIKAAPGNTRSRAIPERLGFTHEGVLREAERIEGRYVDHVVYGLLEHEWSG